LNSDYAITIDVVLVSTIYWLPGPKLVKLLAPLVRWQQGSGWLIVTGSLVLGSVPSTVCAYPKDPRHKECVWHLQGYKKHSGDPWEAPCGSAGTAQGDSGTQMVHTHTLQSNVD